MNAYQNADLHCHSTFSDGTLLPAELALRAKERGVDLWALSDHDELAGLAVAAQAAKAQGLDFVTGVEISVTFINTTVHIVGLGVDPHNTDLTQGLRRSRSGRDGRAQKIAERLAALGIAGAYEGALRFVSNPDLVSRTHFARYLVECGACRDTSEVFQKYLGDGKAAYVPFEWASLRNAVQWIVNAGGVAIIAHPARYQFTANEEFALFSEFKALGGQGVEVVTGSHLPSEYPKYAAMAQEFDLAASCGSDFHSPEESRTDLGSLPPLPAGLRPVWSLLESQIQRACA